MEGDVTYTQDTRTGDTKRELGRSLGRGEDGREAKGEN